VEEFVNSIAEFGKPLVINKIPSAQDYFDQQQQDTPDLHLLYRATDEMVQYIQSVMQSDWITGLGQYGVEQGSFYMYSVVNDPCPKNVGNTDIENMIINLISQYLLPAPDRNTVYLVFTRPWVSQYYTWQGLTQYSGTDFIGYHNAVTVPPYQNNALDEAMGTWRTISYASIVWSISGDFAFPSVRTEYPLESIFDLFDAHVLLNMPTVTHELAEAFVNPDPHYPAFVTAGGCEICDICNHGASGIPNPTNHSQPYPVSTYWSNSDDACIAAAPLGTNQMG
jgi:hypothetical protein